LPHELLQEAERLLKALEAEPLALGASGVHRGSPTRYTQAILLAADSAPPPSELEAALRALDPNRMTPVEALQWLVDARRRLAASLPAEPP
jgi:hypothetical protein